MMFSSSQMICFRWITLLSLLKYIKISSSAQVSLTTPINPVKENGMLALHCQIWDLLDTEVVMIYRWVGGESQTISVISWGDDILSSVDERAYLARRILTDGSVVYFLSITRVKQEDQGDYSCEVLAGMDQGLSRVSIDSVAVRVQYFPNDQYPLCTLSAPPVILTGTRIALNCSSEEGFPTVALVWKRTGTDETPKVVQVNAQGTSFVELYLDVSVSDKDAVFLCQMRSAVFPNLVGSCHVGPLNVIPNPSQTPSQVKESLLPNHVNVNPALGEIVTARAQTDGYTETAVNVPKKDKLHCKRLCSNMSSNLSVWRIATLIASAVAFVLLIIGIAIYIKIRQESAYNKKRRSQQLPAPRQPIDCLYEELKYRQDNEGNKVYMALVRPRKPDSLAVPVRSVDMEGNYTLTPTTINNNVSSCQ